VVRYFTKFSDVSLQCTSLSSFLWEQSNWSVVIQTWSWCGKDAASTRACLEKALVFYEIVIRFSYQSPIRNCYTFFILKCKRECDQVCAYLQDLPRKRCCVVAGRLPTNIAVKHVFKPDCRKSSPHSRILFALSPEVVQTWSHFPLDFDIGKICQIRT